MDSTRVLILALHFDTPYSIPYSSHGSRDPLDGLGFALVAQHDALQSVKRRRLQPSGKVTLDDENVRSHT